MKWTIERPRVVAEDDKESVCVEAETIEGAITEACRQKGWHTTVGETFIVHARVKVAERKPLPLKSV